ncbi:MAG: hypothetical protein ACOYXR_14730 [Nitrospirota bacterium]
MSEHNKINGAAAQMRIMVPTPLYLEVTAALGERELNDAVVESLKEILRKLRFKRDLERVASSRKS